MRFEFRTTDGRACCASDDPDHLCTHCKAALAREEALMPDPYAAGLVTLRALHGNTIEAMERSGRTLDRVSIIYGVYAGTMCSSDFQALEREVEPLMAAFRDQLRAQAITASLRLPYATSDVHREPPDSYALALERMKEAQR